MRRADYEFFTNKSFIYKIREGQLSAESGKDYVLYLTPQWDDLAHWTLQIGELVEKSNDYSGFYLPVRYDSFRKWHNSSESSFDPLKNHEGYFSSDYSTFIASRKEWNVSNYKLGDKYYVDFVYENERHSFYYEPKDLVEAEW